jgi:hypothetical protein
MEAELKHGCREYIRVLRLLEKHSLKQLTAAVEKSLRHRVHTPEAIEQFLPNSTPWRQTTFKLNGREHLQHVKISQADIEDYNELLDHGGAA